MKMTFNVLRNAAIGLITGVVLLANAQAIEAVPTHIQNEIPQARLSGEGAFTWFGLKIYDAQLWVGANGYRSQTPSSEQFALDLHYARDLRGKKIAEASDEQMTKLGVGTVQQRAIWKADMTRIFPDVKEGAHLTGVYLPNIGARFYLDQKPIGDIMDVEFAKAFFAIWLAPKTTAPQLRQALLKNAEAR